MRASTAARHVLEISVEDNLVRSVARAGGQCLKLRPPTGRGFPDRTVLLPGGFAAFVELKRPVGGVVAKHQAKWLAAIRQTEHRAVILLSHAEVDAFMDAYDVWRATGVWSLDALTLN